MMAARFIEEIAQHNIHLWTDGKQLHVRAPKGALTPELRTRLAIHKSEVLTALCERNGLKEEATQVVCRPQQRYEPFPLTEIQQAYWIGRSAAFDLGNVACHAYYEVEATNLDIEQLTLAFRKLIDRHDMLRSVMLPDGRQQVLKQVPPYNIETLDLRGENLPVCLEAIRTTLSHQVLPASRWPMFEIRASLLDAERVRLHLSFDILIADVWSLQIIFQEWFEMYRNPDVQLPALELTFRDYVLARNSLRDTKAAQSSREYWLKRAAHLPPGPELPLAVSPGSISEPRFTRRSGGLQSGDWLRLKNRAAEIGLTPSVALLAAYAEVLARWSKSPRFTINMTLLGRLPLHPQANRIVGDFTRLLPLEVDASKVESFQQRASRIHAQLIEDIEHSDGIGIETLREMARAEKRAPFTFPTVFTSMLSNHRPVESPSRMLWMGDVVYGITQTPQVWLDHQVFEEDGALVFNWDAVEALFPENLLDDMFDAYCGFLTRLAGSEAAWQEARRELLPAAQVEQRRMMNATEAHKPPVMLQDLFLERAREFPHREAIVTTQRRFTYQELDRISNQVAHRLRVLGARPNTLVAIVMEKGWEQAVATLAILKSGAAYLPLNPRLPEKRLLSLLEHGEVRVLLTQASVERSITWPESVKRIHVDELPVGGLYDEPLDPVQRPEDLAYVIYTSGSTGIPKGVMIDHRAAVNTIIDINSRFRVGPQDRILALSELSFDLSVYDLFGALAAGAAIVIPDAGGLRDPAHWSEMIEREQVTIWNSVPALMEMLVAYAAARGELVGDRLRLAMLSGDWIPVTLPDHVRALVPNIQVISLGGATEAAIWSILYQIEEVEPGWSSIPYGRPMRNQSFHVLNETLEPCPVWVPGQLYIAGEGLAKGYWRDEEKTRASFIDNPQTGERMYRTGDLGRYLPSANIEFLGREDSQVKVRGYRIELGEIEAALLKHEAVRAAVVSAVGEMRGSKQLVAYIVAEAAASANGELAGFLRTMLPDYMVPSVFVVLDELPLTANGKVDRKSLPNPANLASRISKDAPLETQLIERRVASLVARTLNLKAVEVDANLIELGANSIDMVRIASLVEKEMGFRPGLEELYRSPTVASLARDFGDREPHPVSVLLDAAERGEFKKRQPGLRSLEAGPRIRLASDGSKESLTQKYLERSSQRRFSNQPVSLERLSNMLGCLRQVSIGGKPKRLYASAGSLYPVQVYLHTRTACVEGLDAGVYYYHPVDHSLVALSQGVELDRSIHEPFINRPIFDTSAFSIFLIARLNAIEPMYGEHSLRFATLEAGLMTQLLEMTAPKNLIGLCQVGAIDFQCIRHLFHLDEEDTLIHSLLGGGIDKERLGKWVPAEGAYNFSRDLMGESEEGEL